MKKDNIYLWTGEGWGKTTSAIGVALRAIGHGKRVVIIQFMKGRKHIGEYRVRKRLEPNYEIYQFGTREFMDLRHPRERDRRLAERGLEFARKTLRTRPFLIVLDEINIAAAAGLLRTGDILEFLDSVPRGVTVYMTGRYAPKELIKRADYVTEVVAVKHPRIDPKRAKLGIDY